MFFLADKIQQFKTAKMASKINLKLTNRCKYSMFRGLQSPWLLAGRPQKTLTNRPAPKQPIKKLPPSIEIPANTTVDVIKVLIARATGFSDHNRIGLFDPSTKKTLKNRKAEIGNEEAVVSAGELLVKDLGTF